MLSQVSCLEFSYDYLIYYSTYSISLYTSAQYFLWQSLYLFSVVKMNLLLQEMCNFHYKCFMFPRTLIMYSRVQHLASLTWNNHLYNKPTTSQQKTSPLCLHIQTLENRQQREEDFLMILAKTQMICAYLEQGNI